VTEYLTVVELLAIHDRMLQDFGGAAGIRDGGALESALYRPQTGYYADVVAEAAALFESLVQNHPFVDGNKRVAFAAMDIFLRLNGQVLAVDDVEVHEFIVGGLERGGLERGDLDRDRVDDWIRHHLAVG
jgi:death on curing protein